MPQAEHNLRRVLFHRSHELRPFRDLEATPRQPTYQTYFLSSPSTRTRLLRALEDHRSVDHSVDKYVNADIAHRTKAWMRFTAQPHSQLTCCGNPGNFRSNASRKVAGDRERREAMRWPEITRPHTEHTSGEHVPSWQLSLSPSRLAIFWSPSSCYNYARDTQ
jgi:hypothetical protein